MFLDERDGDEGGIDIDMVPYFEKHLEGGNGFENATSAISAALKDNEVLTTEKSKDEVEDQQQDVQMDEVQMCDVDKNPIEPVSANETASQPNPIVQEESIITNTTSVQSNKSANPQVRKSNIVTSWTDSTNTIADSQPKIKRNLLRRSCNKLVKLFLYFYAVYIVCGLE